MSSQEPQLNYNAALQRWEGENEEFVLWMDDATFYEYVTAWVALRKVGQTPQEWVATAAQYCRHLCYWRSCACNYDRRVHLVRKPLTHTSANVNKNVFMEMW